MAHYITDRCVGCGICEPKCPTLAIFGIKKFRYYIDSKVCIDCHVCGRWCGLSAIVDNNGKVVNKIKPKEMPKALVYEEDCTGCEMCISICPKDSIKLKSSNGGVNLTDLVATVDSKTCVGCGVCEDICIKGAIRIIFPSAQHANMQL